MKGKSMNDINLMFEEFHISDPDKKLFDKFFKARGEATNHDKYEIKTIVIGDTNHSFSSKDDDHA